MIYTSDFKIVENTNPETIEGSNVFSLKLNVPIIAYFVLGALLISMTADDIKLNIDLNLILGSTPNKDKIDALIPSSIASLKLD